MSVSTRALGALAALLLAVSFLLLVQLIVGCSGGLPVVRVTHVEGAGAIDLETCTEQPDGSLTGCIPHSLAFASEGREVTGEDGATEIVHCAVIRRLVLVGLPFGVGLLPAPLSDSRCQGVAFDPFPGARPTLALDE